VRLIEPLADRSGHDRRDGGDDVLAVGEGQRDMLKMERTIGEDRDRVDIPIPDHLFQPRIGLRALVGRHQLFAPVWQQIGDRFDDAVRMLIPVKLQSETSASNAKANFAARRLPIQASRNKGGHPGQRGLADKSPA